MKRQDPKERAAAGLADAKARFDREQGKNAGLGPEPWPGDLFVLAESADFPVEWLLVERERRGRCRLVATDTHSILGLADVALPVDAPGGPLSVRCAVGLSIGVDILRQGQRTGAVEAEDLDRVRQRCREQDRGVLADSRLGAGGEPDPDYEDWLDEVLLPARAALSPAVQNETIPARRWSVHGAVAALAVALLLALGGVSALAWRFHQAERQAWKEIHQLLGEREEARIERQRLLATHQQELATLQAAETRRLAELRAEVEPVAPPAPSRPSQLLANVAYVAFYPGKSRGTVREIPFPAEASSLLAAFYVGEPPAFPEYRLEMTGPSGAAVRSLAGLRPLPNQEVSVVVPRAQLPDGVYRFHLFGLSGGEKKSVGEYEVKILSQADTTSNR